MLDGLQYESWHGPAAVLALVSLVTGLPLPRGLAVHASLTSHGTLEVRHRGNPPIIDTTPHTLTSEGTEVPQELHLLLLHYLTTRSMPLLRCVGAVVAEQPGGAGGGRMWCLGSWCSYAPSARHRGGPHQATLPRTRAHQGTTIAS